MEANYQIVEIEIAQAKARLAELSNILVDAVDSGASVSFMIPFTLIPILYEDAHNKTLLGKGGQRSWGVNICSFTKKRYKGFKLRYIIINM